MTVDISVVIPTYNRAELLQRSLEALRVQRAPHGLEWEIVVVDNKSTDTTKGAVASCARRMPVDLRYLFEGEQGASAARNAGVARATGRVVAFTDDDVEPAPDWLSMIAVAMADSTADLVGGRILPIWSSPPPKWLADDPELRVWLALMEYGRPAVLRSATEDDARIWTANMAVKRSVITALGRFDTRRGPVGDRLRRDEDADLVARALGAGYRAVYDPRLVVRHHVTPDRLCRGYFRRFSREVAEGRAELEVWPARRSLWGASFSSYRYAGSRVLRWLMVLLAGRRGAFRAELEFQAALGRLRGRWKAYGRRYRRESQS